MICCFKLLLTEEKRRARRVAGDSGVPVLFEKPKVTVIGEADADDEDTVVSAKKTDIKDSKKKEEVGM